MTPPPRKTLSDEEIDEVEEAISRNPDLRIRNLHAERGKAQERPEDVIVVTIGC